MTDSGETYSVDDALIATGFGKLQYLVLAYAGMAWISEAMEMMILSFVGPALKSAWKLSIAQESLLSTIVFVGMLVGAYSWGVVSDTYGRRYAFFHYFYYIWDGILFLCIVLFSHVYKLLNNIIL